MKCRSLSPGGRSDPRSAAEGLSPAAQTQGHCVGSGAGLNGSGAAQICFGAVRGLSSAAGREAGANLGVTWSALIQSSLVGQGNLRDDSAKTLQDWSNRSNEHTASVNLVEFSPSDAWAVFRSSPQSSTSRPLDVSEFPRLIRHC